MSRKSRLPDGYIENSDQQQPVHRIRRQNAEGKITEWICVEEEIFEQLFSIKIMKSVEEESSLPIFKFKKREEDDPLREEIAQNFDAAIEKRAEKGEKTDLLKEIADFYGYDDVRSIQNAKSTGKNKKKKIASLHAEDIRNLEDKFGIHRDEILGSINKPEYYNNKWFRSLQKHMQNEDLEVRAAVGEVLKEIIDRLNKCKDEWDIKNECDKIKQKLDRN